VRLRPDRVEVPPKRAKMVANKCMIPADTRRCAAPL
jgi:hypothetical protein